MEFCLSLELIISVHNHPFDPIETNMVKKIEQICGVDLLNDRRLVPGMNSPLGREYWYIQDDGKNDFDSLFHRLVRAIEPPLHSRGGALTGGCELTLPDGRKFHALSYKGDLEGWREQIRAGAKKLNLSAAMVVDDVLVFSEGEKIPLSDCKPRRGYNHIDRLSRLKVCCRCSA
jgi:hypothetical protein